MYVYVYVFMCAIQGLVFRKILASFVECSFSWELKGRHNLGKKLWYKQIHGNRRIISKKNQSCSY